MSDDPERQRLQLLELQNLWLGLEPHQREAASSVIRDLHTLGPNACHVLAALSGRLSLGAEQYREDFTAGRDWVKEATAEALDGSVYLALALSRLAAK